MIRLLPRSASRGASLVGRSQVSHANMGFCFLEFVLKNSFAGAAMDRDTALRLDGMLLGVSGNLDAIAYYMRKNLSESESQLFVRSIGESMAALLDISTALYKQFPDIIPKELRPDTD